MDNDIGDHLPILQKPYMLPVTYSMDVRGIRAFEKDEIITYNVCTYTFIGNTENSFINIWSLIAECKHFLK